MITGVVALALFGAIYLGNKISGNIEQCVHENVVGIRSVMMRAARVYVFVFALMLLGEGFTPLVIWHFARMPPHVPYWVNMISGA